MALVSQYHALFCLLVRCIPVELQRLNMRRTTRSRAPIKFFDDNPDYIKPSKLKKPKKTQSPPPDRPEIRAAEDPPAPEVKDAQAGPLPTYSPPIQVPFVLFKLRWTEREPIDLFLKLLGWESVLAIVAATNAHARASMGPDQQFVRTWSDLNPGELLCWLGLLFCMGSRAARRRKDHWPTFAPFMSEWRWNQIHRHLTFNIDSTKRPLPDFGPVECQPWWKVEPVYSTVRANCIQAVEPSSWISVDEIMVPFRGRSAHTVKQPNKPID